MDRRTRVRLSMFLFLAMAVVAWPQKAPDFSACRSRIMIAANGDVMATSRLRIELRNSRLTVQTTMSRGSDLLRHAIQAYTTDGKRSASTGADGDEFLTAVIWKSTSLD